MSGSPLEGLLDGFDRLYDGHCPAIDAYALLAATAAALGESELAMDLDATAEAVLAIVRSGRANDDEQDAALDAVQPRLERLRS